MNSTDELDPMPRTGRSAPASACSLDQLRAMASVVRLAHHQRLPVDPALPGLLYVVSSGILVLQADVTDTRRVLPCLLYPGDVFEPAHAPPLKDAALMAAAPAEVLRLNMKSYASLAQDNSGLYRALHQRLVAQHARLTLHVNTIGMLSGEERVAALLIEFTLRLGKPVAGGIAFDTPLTRSDMADYLALNRDTLSRLMSRLKASRILLQMDRSHLVVRDWDGLLAECPIAETLQALHRGENPLGQL